MSDFRLRLSVDNPFKYANEADQTDYLNFDREVSKHKAFALQISRARPYHLFEVDLRLCFTGEDHAGPSLNLAFLWWFVVVQFYDIRHWNYDEDRWVIEGEQCE